MDFEEYRKRGKEMVDYIADYLENIRDRKVFPDVKPGYMKNLLPDSAPVDGEKWDNIFHDVERVIMPGITHWQSPHMHAYFPALNSFPSMLGDMLADAINCLGFTWASSPACTELETIVMNWLGKMIGLPDEFLQLGIDSKGGGVIQTTASEATLVCLLAGRTRAIKKFHEKNAGFQDAEINARLVAYCSDQAHSSVEKAALIGLVRMRYIESDENLSMRGGPLREAIEKDIKQGLIPFWVCATLGTTGACSFDIIDEVGVVCQEFNLWLHLDAAYAGSAFICPEHRIWLKGVDKADSIAFNPSKWLMVHFDCTAMWVKDSNAVHRTFNVEPLYLQHENSGLAIDYMHWQIPLSKRFRSLKLWFVLRSFGIKGLQKHIREGVRLAQKFEALVLADHRFEVPARRHLGMVVFRVKGDNDLTERLLKRLNHRGNLHAVPASLKGKYVIRFTVTSTRTTTEDILKDWSEIRYVTTELLTELNIKIGERAKVSLKDTKEKNDAFGSSLLLSNSPMSPKIVNGSFAAIFDADEFLAKTYAGIRIAHQDSPSMRRRVRGILMSGKQFSLDSHMDIVVQSCADSEPYGQENPICEDNEDAWEAFESPIATPITPPPPIISPMISLPPSVGKNLKAQKVVVSQPTTNLSIHHENCDVVPIPNKLKPNTLAIPKTINKISSYSENKIYNINSSSQTVECKSLQVAELLNTSSNKNSECTKNCENNLNNAGQSGSISKNIYVYSCNGKPNSAPIKTSQINENDDKLIQKLPSNLEKSSTYHGKRYLDPILPDVISNGGFYNDGFCATIENPFYWNKRSENDFNVCVDWEAVMKNFNRNNINGAIGKSRYRKVNVLPKFNFNVNTVQRDRTQKSFDSSGPEDSFSDIDISSPPSLCSSSEYDTDSQHFKSIKNEWTIEQEKLGSSCKNCGHSSNSTPGSSAGSSSSMT